MVRRRWMQVERAGQVEQPFRPQRAARVGKEGQPFHLQRAARVGEGRWDRALVRVVREAGAFPTRLMPT